jgi:type IX secretion system PorP/SprF family membrane protein
MTKIRLFFFSLFLIVITGVIGKAQSDSSRISLGYPIYSQYLQNGLMINPAYTGSRGSLSGFLSYRMQWMGIKGAPSIQSLSLHTPMKDDKVALGIMAQFMQFGFTRSTSIYASYAYHIRVRNGKLSFGLKAGTDISNTVYPNDNFLTTSGDPVFVNNKAYILPNIGAGIYYFSDKLFAGFSIPSFLSYRKSGTGSIQPFHRFSEYDLIFSAGSLITLSPLLKLKPSFLIDYSLQRTKRLTQLDINANLILADLIWMGASWRTSEQVLVGILQVQLNPQLMFGFSYDYSVGRMNSYSKGTSEFILRYEFGSRVSAANPRYF